MGDHPVRDRSAQIQYSDRSPEQLLARDMPDTHRKVHLNDFLPPT